MSYVIKYSDPLKTAIVVDDLTINGPLDPSTPALFMRTDNVGVVEATTPLVITGRGVPNYGDFVQNNVVYLLENFCNTFPPVFPTTGQLWYKNTALPLRVPRELTPGIYQQPLDAQGMYVCTTIRAHLSVLSLPASSAEITSISKGVSSTVSVQDEGLLSACNITVGPSTAGTPTSSGKATLIFPAPINLDAPTPIAGNSTVYNATFVIDGVTIPLAVAGTSVQTYKHLLMVIYATLNEWTLFVVSGDPLKTDLDVGGYRLINVADPVNPTDGTTLGFSDGRYLKLDQPNAPITSNMVIDALAEARIEKLTFANDEDIVNKRYVDVTSQERVARAGDMMVGTLGFGATSTIQMTAFGGPAYQEITLGNRIVREMDTPLNAPNGDMGANVFYVNNQIDDLRVELLDVINNPPSVPGDGVVVSGVVDANTGTLTLNRSVGGDVTITGFAQVRHVHDSSEVLVNVDGIVGPPSGLALAFDDRINANPTAAEVFAALDSLAYRGARPARSQIITASAVSTITLRDDMEYIAGVDAVSVHKNGIKYYPTQYSTGLVRFDGYLGIQSEQTGTGGFQTIVLSAPVTTSTPTGLSTNGDILEAVIEIDGQNVPVAIVDTDSQTYGDLLTWINVNIGTVAVAVLDTPTTIRITARSISSGSTVNVEQLTDGIFAALALFGSYGASVVGTSTPTVDVPMKGTYGFTVTVGGASHAVAIDVDPISTSYRDIYYAINEQLEAQSAPVTMMLEQFYSKLFFKFVSTVAGPGNDITITNTGFASNYLFDVMPLFTTIAYDNASSTLGYTYGADYGQPTTSLVFTDVLTAGDVIEVIIT